MSAYYNEIDPKAAAWLRELIKRNLICVGEVDERSIEVVQSSDLAGFTQCHFFAGVGVWSHALRQAGWRDTRPVWTGSCPCQPFSAAGKGEGVDDKRHLWPHFYRLIDACRPDTIFGEQVASAAVIGRSVDAARRCAAEALERVWLDVVSADLESAGYACGAADIPAAGVGAPHIRQRLWWLADATSERLASVAVGHASRPTEGGGQRRVESGSRLELGHTARRGRGERRDASLARSSGHSDGAGITSPDGVALGDAIGSGLERLAGHGDDGDESRRNGTDATRPVATASAARDMEDADGERRDTPGRDSAGREDAEQPSIARGMGDASGDGTRQHARELSGDESQHEERAAGGDYASVFAGATRGFWADADWIPCSDGKARPVEPGSFPLAHGAPARVGRLRGYGNAIVAEVAREFIEAYLDVTEGELIP